MECLFCNTELENIILDLGHSPLANDYLTQQSLVLPETNFPLKVCVCHHCFLVQLYGRTNPQIIFNEHYTYVSASSQTWIAHCQAYAEDITTEFELPKDGLIVEIGSNDGTLLLPFIDKGYTVLGIDPASTVAAIATAKQIPVIVDFFTHQLATTLCTRNQKAALITGNNVFAHVPNINDFVSGIATLLQDDGICTLEFPYLPDLLVRSEFDTVYHEHFFYFSLTTLQTIFNHHGLTLFNAKRIQIHGGSMRVYLQKKDVGQHAIQPIVQELLLAETNLGLNELPYYYGLQAKALGIKQDFLYWLMNTIKAGKKVMAYGAAAKGNTFLNYCGIKSDLIPYVADVTLQKQGKFMPGSHIPIVAESVITDYKPDYIIVLPWNFKEEINNRLTYIQAWGGKLVYFIPYFEMV